MVLIGDVAGKVLTLQDDGTLKSDSEVGNINKEISFLVGMNSVPEEYNANVKSPLCFI